MELSENEVRMRAKAEATTRVTYRKQRNTLSNVSAIKRSFTNSILVELRTKICMVSIQTIINKKK